MSVLAIFISGFIALATMLPAARNISSGELGGIRSTVGTATYYIVRLSYAFSRAVPELIWALLIVFFLSPGVLAGALALAFHNFGIIGRLTAEVVENIDPAPSRALKTAGASNIQIFLYGILPQTLPQFLTYSLYRWEVVIRTTVVIGFVGAGGLGREFILRLNWFHYTDVTLLIGWYLILVLFVDIVSFCLRKLSKFS
jgi:phosphonate transport system permease protein